MLQPSENTICQVLAYAELGGAAQIGLKLTQESQNHSHKGVIFTPPAGRARQVALQAGLNNVSFNNNAIFSKNRVTSIAGNLYLAKALRNQSPQLVHVHCPFAYSAFRWALRLCGARRVVHVHIETPAESLQQNFRQPPELIVTCARYLIENVRKSLKDSLKPVRIEAVPNSVDLAKFHAGDRFVARQKIGIKTNRPVVLILANIAPHKGHATAIRAVKELKRRNKDVELWCAGIERDGDACTLELRLLISQLNLSGNVRFLGFRSDVAELLRASDVLILPSTHEGLPLTILEAQATKIPVVAAPTAGIPEVVLNGETGFLVPPDDYKGYADRLETLLANPCLRNNIITSAHANIVTNHTWEAYSRRMFELYDELINGQ